MGVISCGTTMIDQGQFQNLDVLSWDTTAKTANFTAVAGNGYFVNTTSTAITVTLPASPSAGDQVAIKDYAATSATNSILIARNSSNISGEASDVTIAVNGISVLFLYVDATQGWSQILTGENLALGEKYVAATGGTITTSGDYKIHKFTGPGTFTVTCAGTSLGSDKVDYMIVAGGGGAGPSHASAGGAGGFRETPGSVSGCYTASPIAGSLSAFSVAATGYPVVVGAGGAGGFSGNAQGSNGSDSSVFGFSSAGGGAGQATDAGTTGNSGGSGGGGSGIGPRPDTGGGAGNTPSTAPAQGTNGGNGSPFPKSGPGIGGGGGGGGATVAGSPATPTGSGPGSTGGNGGNGATTNISASPLTFAGGGGGGGWNGSNSSGGAGGGGPGIGGSGVGTAGTVNTGGGGGGTGPGSNPSSANGAGGSGIVYIRYKFQ
jgi:hypothetical protein